MWRCVKKSLDGYCKGTPEWETEPIDITESLKEKIEESKASYYPTYSNGTCKLQPETCGRFLTISELNAMTHIPIIEHKAIETPTPQQEPQPKKAKPRQVEQE